jgi:hypothetical protein
MLVGPIVAADQVDFLVLGNGLVDQAQELQPLLMPMPFLAEPKHFTVERVDSPDFSQARTLWGFCVCCVPVSVI